LGTRSRVADAAASAGALAVALLGLAPLAIHLGATSPFTGFRLFLLGMLAGLIALVLGLAGLWSTRASAGRSGRGRALAGALLGLLAVGLPFGLTLPARALPRINDITTNPADPPAFAAALRINENQGRDFAYPADFAPLQQKGYPDLAPIRLPIPPAQAFGEARRAATSLGWEITAEDSEAGTLEAYAVSRVFEFVDDIAIRVRPDGAGSVVDVRSKSRVGRGDLGANAARIRAFRSALAGR
jgi:uncharacterized protein (DUF1499 family)